MNKVAKLLEKAKERVFGRTILLAFFDENLQSSDYRKLAGLKPLSAKTQKSVCEPT